MRVFTAIALFAIALPLYAETVKERLDRLDKLLAQQQSSPKAEPTFQQQRQHALDAKKPFVIFVGRTGTSRLDDVAVTASADRMTGYPAECVIVAWPYNDGEMRHYKTLPATASTADIRAAITQGRQEVSRSASPFGQTQPPSSRNPAVKEGPLAAADGSSPWLAVSEQQKVKAMWPEGVPLPKTLQFYVLKPASQSIDKLSLTGGPENLIPRNPFFSANSQHTVNVNREFPYIGSGGMDWAKKGTWRNATGLAIPEGEKVVVWEHLKGIWNGSNFQNEYILDWKFPDKTQAFDVLIRKNDDGTEHIFTVRVRSKDGGKWDDGVSFFPDVPAGKEATYKTVGTHRNRDALGVPLISYKVSEVEPLEVRKYPFKEQRTAINDGGHFFPPGFIGTGMSCSKCHMAAMTNEKAPYSGPMLRGMDTVFSWHPAKASSVSDRREHYEYKPKLDYRWPIKVVSGGY